MNFVLFHKGSKWPKHIQYCIKQILYTNPCSKIYIITNFNIEHHEQIIHIPLTTLTVPDIGNYYLHDPMGELFRNAMLRIFYIEAFLKQYNIKNIIHIDNDVLIYDNINKIENELIKHDFLMSCADPLNYSFGFSYIKSDKSLYEVNNQLLNLIIQGENSLEKQVGGMPHEMRLLNYINQHKKYIDILPILPSDNNFNNFNYCFDPSSYGQFLGGAKPETDKYVGSKLIENKISVEFKNNRPILIMNNKEYNIFNLHIHNKKLQEFYTKKTSVSDIITYKQICAKAGENNTYFNNFKNMPQYKEILEHVSYEEGLAYYEAFKYDKDISDNLNKFSKNDIIGNPTKYKYNFGTFSPTTLRYIKVLKDLKDLHDLNDLNIIEIGAGYGGQYTVLRQLFKPKLYTFVDLEEVINLIKKYLDTLNLADQTNYIIGTNNNCVFNNTYDLVISNYAISECTKEVQDFYIDNVLSKSKHGYIIHNNLRGYTANELSVFLSEKGIKNNIIKETPQTCSNNVLLTW